VEPDLQRWPDNAGDAPLPDVQQGDGASSASSQLHRRILWVAGVLLVNGFMAIITSGLWLVLLLALSVVIVPVVAVVRWWRRDEFRQQIAEQHWADCTICGNRSTTLPEKELTAAAAGRWPRVLGHGVVTAFVALVLLAISLVAGLFVRALVIIATHTEGLGLVVGFVVTVVIYRAMAKPVLRRLATRKQALRTVIGAVAALFAALIAAVASVSGLVAMLR
jgi:hypothetical protein